VRPDYLTSSRATTRTVCRSRGRASGSPHRSSRRPLRPHGQLLIWFPRILKIDASGDPAKIVKAIPVTYSDGSVPEYDLEGIVQREDGGFWLCSEGDDSPNLPNLLVRVDKYGEVEEEIALPPAVDAKKTGNGFEGVTVVYDGGKEIVYVAIQRELKTETSGYIRIAEYRPAEDDPSDDSDGWRFFLYPREAAPTGATVGLSEIVALGKHRFAIIERDNQRGPNAKIKWITEFSIKGIMLVAEGHLPKLEKKLVATLPPERTHSRTQDKIEGLAVS
jgi:hypothetical protein